MKYEIDIEISQGDNIGELHCNVELELEIACFCEEVEIEDFTVNKVYVYDDSDGSEYVLRTAKETNGFTMQYTSEIQAALDADESLMSQIADFLQDERDEYLISNYEDNRQAHIDHWELSNY